MSEHRFFLLPLGRYAKESYSCIFGQSQVVEVMQEIIACEVPFCPRFMRGAAVYGEQLLPVICPEEMLGLADPAEQGPYRQFIVIRSAAVDPASGTNLLAMVASSRGLQIPQNEEDKNLEYFSPSDQVPANGGLLNGIYSGQGRRLISIDFDRLLLGAAMEAVA
ncbi:hypothetical protein [Desulfogranum mediterraneum]|uniref:hypothetical protein n=1 Tax=Desulfogranum mediterraneum TaxID=160661 RepID=UPI000406748F|nr:hypothetical protein [Desulfogranum mediterraneum]